MQKSLGIMKAPAMFFMMILTFFSAWGQEGSAAKIVVPVESEVFESLALDSVEETLRQNSRATWHKHGGRKGMLQLRLRGARSFEPRFYFDDVPLFTGLFASQNLSIVPFSLVARTEFRSDSVPAWLGSTGNSGNVLLYSFFPKTHSQDFDQRKTSIEIGEYGFYSLSSYLRIGNHRFSLDFEQSEESFLIQDDSGTLKDSSDDVIHPQQGFHYDQKSVGYSLGSRFSTFFSNELRHVSGEPIETTFVLAQYRGGNEYPFQTYVTFEEQVRPVQSDQWNVLHPQTSDYGQLGFRFLQNMTFPYLDLVQLTESYSYHFLDHKTENIYEQVNQVKAFKHRFVVGLNIENLIFHFVDARLLAHSALEVDHFSTSCEFYEQTPECQKSLEKVSASKPEVSLELGKDFGLLYLKSLLSFTTRTPSLGERYGSAAGIAANMNLKDEVTYLWENSILFSNFEGGVFFAKDENLITLHRIGPQHFRHQNSSYVLRHGLFLGSHYRWNDSVTLHGNYQYTQSMLDGVWMPLVPVHALYSYLNWQASHWFESLVSAQWMSSYFVDSLNQIELQVPVRLDFKQQIHTSWSEFFLKNLTFEFTAENVLYDRYSQVQTTLGQQYSVAHKGFAGFLTPGKRFYLKIIGSY